MQARLVVRGGSEAGRVYPIAGVTSLGRGANNDIVIDSPHVSRRHAEIRWGEGGYIVEDLESKNGLAVNGQRVTGAHPLQAGDLMVLAGQPELALLFEVSDATVTVHAPTGTTESISIDPRTADVHVRGQRVILPPKEYFALALLYERGGALVTKEELASRVWPEFGGAVSDASIEQIISRLRRKLEPQPAQPQHLLTVRGRGYRLVVA